MVHAKIVRNFAIVGYIEDGEVCEFANFKRADVVIAAERVGGINGGGGDCFSGRHAHLSAGERENHRHGQRGAGARVEVSGERDDGSGVDELARGPVMREAEMEAAAWKHGAGDVGAREGANVRGGEFFEMVCACGVHFDGEACRAGPGKLFGMKAQSKAAGASGGQDFARLSDGERAAVAEDIAEFGKVFGGDAWEPFAADEVDVGVGRFAVAIAKLSRDDMSAEKCGNDFERLFAIEFAEKREDFAFAGPVEAVAGFGFDGGCPVGGELREMSEGARFELRGRSSAKFADAIENAAARPSNFFVCGAGDALFVFGGARTRMNKVRVRIDEAGNDDAAGEIEFADAAGFGQAFDAAARTDGGDVSVANEKRRVGDDLRISERTSPTRRGASKRKDLRAIGQEQRMFWATRVGHFELDVHGTEKRGEAQVPGSLRPEARRWNSGVYSGATGPIAEG